ncbi:MAG: hypothetical protein ACRCXC_01765 [Legionella sp.]
MNNKFPFEKIFENLVPFIVAGIAIALLLGVLFMFSYILIWGIILGGFLWLVATIKQLLFPKPSTKTEIIQKNQGRIIEHDDKK